MNQMSTEQAARVAAISRTPITMLPVMSSQIAEIGHDPNTNTLAIRFQPKEGAAKGQLYHYGNVDAGLFLQFQSAESVGSFFYKNIKPNADEFPFVKVEADQPAAGEGTPAQQAA